MLVTPNFRSKVTDRAVYFSQLIVGPSLFVASISFFTTLDSL